MSTPPPKGPVAISQSNYALGKRKYTQMAWGLLAWALNKHRFLGTPSASLTHVSKWGLSTGDGKSLSFSLFPAAQLAHRPSLTLFPRFRSEYLEYTYVTPNHFFSLPLSFHFYFVCECLKVNFTIWHLSGRIFCGTVAEFEE